MKTSKHLFAITLVLAASLLAGCKKESTIKYTSISDFFSQNKIATQTFTVNAATGGTITGAKGTVVTFPAIAFVNGVGATVSGNVTVQLKEVFSKADMIFEKVFPIAYGGALLNSAGEYFISAEQNGDKVNVKKGRFVEVQLPAQAVAPNMQFFFGVLEDTMQNLVWVLPDTAQMVVDSQWVNTPVGSFTFTSVPDSTYIIDVDSLGWHNVDGYMTSVNQNVTCQFTFNEDFEINSTNTSAYALLDGTNAVWPTGGAYCCGTLENNIMYDSHLADIPMHIVVITVKDGVLYSGTLAVTPANGGNYPIDISPTTKENLDALLLSFQ